MEKKILTEGMEHNDLEGQMEPLVTIDEYEAQAGENSQIITLSFIVRSKRACEDLAGWFERGYDWVVDAQASEGEVRPRKYLLFVEIPRRSSAPERIVELLDDLTTLNGISLSDWTVKIDKEEFSADAAELQKAMILSPHEYREEKEKDEVELNEFRKSAGLQIKPIYKSNDADIKAYKALAGL